MPPPPANDNARGIFIILLILWRNAGSDTGPGLLSAPSLISARLHRQRDALAVLGSTRWGDFAPGQRGGDGGERWLNLTGFRQDDGYGWEDLGRFRERSLLWSRGAYPADRDGTNLWDQGQGGPTWLNATGAVHGAWVRRGGVGGRDAAGYNLSAIAPGVSWAGGGGGHSDWGRNVTGAEGKVILRIEDKDGKWEYNEVNICGEPPSGGLVREVAASVTLEDELGTGSTHEMRLHGVHWPRQGAMLLATTSEKFAGIFGLPHLAPGRHFYTSSQRLLNATLDDVLRRREKTRFSDPSNPWSSSPNTPQEGWSPTPHCEYVMYVQVHPLDPQQLGQSSSSSSSSASGPAADHNRLAGLVETIEHELRYPTGAPIGPVPQLQMSTVMFSPDCSYFLESKGPPLYAPADGRHLLGMKEELYVYDVKVWLLAYTTDQTGQVQLLKRQVRESSTPSTLGRISFHTVSMMLLADGIVFAAASAMSLSVSTTFLPALLVTFASFLAMTIGGSFLAEIYKAQEPERRTRERDQPTTTTSSSTANTPRPPSTPANIPLPGELPRPVTAPPPRDRSPPIIIPSDQDIDAEIAENVAAGGASAVPMMTGGGAATTAAPTPPPQPGTTAFSTIAGRFIMTGAFLLFLSLAATSWWASVRAAYANLVAFLYLSLWVPQMVRNVQRNSRRAFSWRFMIGQSVLRLLPLAYFYLREETRVFARPDPYSFAVLAGWLWVQLWVMAFQDVLGPRFGIPRRWTPEAWDYHPVLSEDC